MYGNTIQLVMNQIAINAKNTISESKRQVLIDIVNVLMTIDDHFNKTMNKLEKRRRYYSDNLCRITTSDSDWENYYDSLGTALGVNNLYREINQKIISEYERWQISDDLISWFSEFIDSNYSLPEFHINKYGNESAESYYKKVEDLQSYIQNVTPDQNRDELHVICFKNNVNILIY